MRLGPIEKRILSKLVPDEFVPPSVYRDHSRPPKSNNRAIWRIVDDKKLADLRYYTLTPQEKEWSTALFKTSRDNSEYNAALKPTKKGEEIISSYGLTQETCPPEPMIMAKRPLHDSYFDFLDGPLSECREIPYSQFEEVRIFLLNRLFFRSDPSAFNFNEATTAHADIERTCTVLLKTFLLMLTLFHNREPRKGALKIPEELLAFENISKEVFGEAPPL